MSDISIYTLNARDNFLLEFAKEHFDLSDTVMHNEITHTFNICLNTLKDKKINYSDLKYTLIPSIDRREIALVFDTLQIESSWYGLPVFDRIIPLFDKNSSHSVLVGDYIGNEDLQSRLKQEFLAELTPVGKIDYKHSTQFFIVYINNLTDTMVMRFEGELKKFDAYVGYFDVSNKSFIKDYLSTILVKLFIKSGKYIIQGHEEELDNSENVNMCGYSFEENGYTCKSLQSKYYDLFLTYKIERSVYKGFEADTTLSINAISTNVFDISDFNVIIEKEKFKYLLDSHVGRIKKAGMIKLTSEELEKFIKKKIKSNYIYNMKFLNKPKTLMFNIIVEAKAQDTKKTVKLLVALEYIPQDKTLRLITLF